MVQLTALGYVRVSTDKQAGEGVSLDQQPDALKRWCQQNDVVLLATYTDADVSGTTKLAKRPGGRMLLERARRDRPSMILTTLVDRLFRDTRDGLECMRETFPRLGVRVVCVHESLDLASASGRFTATVRLAAAEYERDLTAERSKRTNTALREQGRAYGGVPYGCVKRDSGKDGRGNPIQRLYREPANWAVRETIVRWATGSDGAQALSLTTIQGMLRDMRIPAPGGGRTWPTPTIRHLVESHHTLTHLPQCGDLTPAGTASPDTEVSV